MVTKQGNDLAKVGRLMQGPSFIVSPRTAPLSHSTLTSTGMSHNSCGGQDNKKRTLYRHKDFSKTGIQKIHTA
jgi:hypothetical protein